MSGSVRRATGVLGGIGLVAGAMSACGESTHPAPAREPLPPIPVVELGGDAVKSGSRLRAVYWESEDGLRVPTRYFLDTERNETCSFADTGSERRCYPEAVDASDTPVDLYAADCRTRVFPDCEPYAFVATPTQCVGTTIAFYALEGELETEPQSGPGCTSTSGQSGFGYRPLGARIPESEFVRATEGTSSPNGERLGFRQLSAEDGSGIALGFFDQDAGTRCDIARPIPDDETLYCVPPCDFTNTYFDDAACSGDGRRLAVETCPGPEVAFSRDERLFYRHGRAVGALPPFVENEGYAPLCSTSPPGSGHELGEVIPYSAFDGIAIQKIGSGRFTRDVWQSSDGRVLLPRSIGDDRSYLWDDMLGITCVIETASDGQDRCMPTMLSTYSPNLFADERCEVPLAADSRARDPSEPHWFLYQPNEWALGCPYPERELVYEVDDAPYTGTVYGATFDTHGVRTCDLFTDTLGQTLYAPKGEVPPSTFGRFEQKVE